jgi:Tfp pilus assembly protein PilE
MKKSKKKQKFTFLELMVVLIISAVIVAIAAPQLGDFYESVKLNGAASQFKLMLEFAKNTAMFKRRICRVYYKADKNEFLLKIQKNPEKDPKKYVLVERALSSVKFGRGIKLIKAQKIGYRSQPVDKSFSFDIHPIINKYEYLFVLQGNEKAKVSITIEPGSGLVKITKE